MQFEDYRRWLNKNDTIGAQEFNYLDSINIGTIICANPDKTCDEIMGIIEDRYENDYLSKHSDDVRLFGNISQSDFIDYIHWRYGIPVKEKTIYRFDILDKMQTIEAERVRRGRWIPHRIASSSMCSECKKYAAFETPYCPHCGAKMDGGE